MNSDGRRNSENDRTIPTCFGKPRECVVRSFTVTLSTMIFVISMILTVYLTYNASMDKVVVVLIVSSCLLYILGFTSNMYLVYHRKPNSVTSRSDGNSNGLTRTTGISAQNSSSERPPDILGFSLARQPIRNTPPPPYEIQMSEMSRMLLPATSRTTDFLTRESEITEEARKLIRSIYEEIRRVDQQAAQSPRNEQSVQEKVQTPETPATQQKRTLPEVSHPNLVVNLQDTAVKSVPVRGHPNLVVNLQETAVKSVPVCGHPNLVVSLQETPVKSVPVRGFTPSDIRPNQANQQKSSQNSLPTQLDLERLIISSEGCAAAPSQPSPRREDSLQVARKKRLPSLSKELQTRPKSRGKTSHVVVDDNDTQNSTYEPIDVVRSISSTNSSQATYDSVDYSCVGSDFEDSSEQASSSACSAASEPVTRDLKRNFRNPRVKVRRQLSEPTTRKFRQLGQSPETFLDAIATCFDLTPDEWMVAWKLSNKGVSPIERARILGVRLYEN